MKVGKSWKNELMCDKWILMIEDEEVVVRRWPMLDGGSRAFTMTGSDSIVIIYLVWCRCAIDEK